MRDTVFKNVKENIVDFAFNEEVVAVFPDMIRRSVPGYETMVPVTGLLAAQALGTSGTAYDLGCSLGATTLAILSQNTSDDINVVGVDNAPAMIEGAKNAVRDPRAIFLLEDITQTSVKDAKVVVLNLVLQFLAPAEREPLLQRIRQEMAPGGMLLLSEKVSHESQQLRAFYDETHLAWKAANGYSALEISQKRAALENVMRIDSETVHSQRLETAGFSSVQQWYRCLNWASFVAYA
ncbi:MAG: carboxy-S-adenosyl-L-methionine synthase CmoA [Pseudomonadota bacterium]